MTPEDSAAKLSGMVRAEDEMADIPAGVLNALHQAGITTVVEFLEMTAADLLATPGIGGAMVETALRAQSRILSKRAIN